MNTEETNILQLALSVSNTNFLKGLHKHFIGIIAFYDLLMSECANGNLTKEQVDAFMFQDVNYAKERLPLVESALNDRNVNPVCN